MRWTLVMYFFYMFEQQLVLLNMFFIFSFVNLWLVCKPCRTCWSKALDLQPSIYPFIGWSFRNNHGLLFSFRAGRDEHIVYNSKHTLRLKYVAFQYDIVHFRLLSFANESYVACSIDNPTEYSGALKRSLKTWKRTPFSLYTNISVLYSRVFKVL